MSKPRLHREALEWCTVSVDTPEDDTLPRILFVGDSITQSYFPETAKHLRGKAVCAACCTSRFPLDPVFLKELDHALSLYPYELIHMNNGLHGWAYSEIEYRDAVRFLLEIVKTRSPEAGLAWATCTPVERIGGDPANRERVVERNKLARQTAERAAIPVNDLYEFVTQAGNCPWSDGVHFTAAASQIIGEHVAAFVLTQLSRRPETRNAARYPYREAYPAVKEVFALSSTVHHPLGAWAAAPGAGAAPLAYASEAPLRLQQAGGSSRVVYDFGEELVGDVAVWVSSAGRGQVKLRYGEYPDEAQCDVPSPIHWYQPQQDDFTVEPGEKTLHNRGRRAFRFLRVESAGPCEVEVLDVSAVCRHYPVQDRGKFACSDDCLNRVWDIARRTTRLCMQQFYEDGIKRDGLLWIGDYRVQYLCNLGAFGDHALARKSLFMMAASQRRDGAIPACAAHGGGHQHPVNLDCMPTVPFGFVADWILLNYESDFISCLREYIWHSGDRSILDELWPCLTRLVGFLVKVEPEKAKAADDFITQGQLSLCLNLYWGLGDALALAAWKGDRSFIETANVCRDRLAARVWSEFFDGNSGWFAKALTGPDAGKPVALANSYAVLSGLAAERLDPHAFMRNLVDAGQALPPHFGYEWFWTLAGIFESGLGGEGIRSIRRHWGPLLDHGLTTCPEALPGDAATLFPQGEKKFKLITSLCHGWTAGPCYLLPRYVLGVHPLSCGYEKIGIAPCLGDLTWAEGTVPTPRGDIVVRVEKTDAGIRSRVHLPESAAETVYLVKGKAPLPLKPGWNVIETAGD